MAKMVLAPDLARREFFETPGFKKLVGKDQSTKK
jgi:hypothetical protein